MTAEPELSVIIPVRNGASEIAQQLQALTDQVWAGTWELLVVNNGSTDNTLEVVESFRNRLPSLRIINDHNGIGVAYARNVGLKHSRARSVVFTDADDEVADGWLAAIGGALRQAQYVGGYQDVEALNPPWLTASRGPAHRDEPLRFAQVLPFAPGANHGVHRELLVRLGGYDEAAGSGEDIDLALRLLVRGIEVHHVPDAVVRYRYRTSAHAMWRQGLAYGEARPRLRKRMIAAGLPAPAALGSWRSWAWLLRHAWLVHSREGRVVYTWVLANRLGQLRGSWRHRCVYL